MTDTTSQHLAQEMAPLLGYPSADALLGEVQAAQWREWTEWTTQRAQDEAQ